MERGQSHARACQTSPRGCSFQGKGDLGIPPTSSHMFAYQTCEGGGGPKVLGLPYSLNSGSYMDDRALDTESLILDVNTYQRSWSALKDMQLPSCHVWHMARCYTRVRKDSLMSDMLTPVNHVHGVS